MKASSSSSGCAGLCLLSAVVESQLDGHTKYSDHTNGRVNRSGDSRSIVMIHGTNKANKSTSSMRGEVRTECHHRQVGTRGHKLVDDNDGPIGGCSTVGSTILSTSPATFMSATCVDNTKTSNPNTVDKSDRVSSSVDTLQTSSLHDSDHVPSSLPRFDDKVVVVVRDGRIHNKVKINIRSKSHPIRISRAVKASSPSKRKGSTSSTIIETSSPQVGVSSSSSSWPTVFTPSPPPKTTSTNATIHPSTNSRPTPIDVQSPQTCCNPHNVFLSDPEWIMLLHEDPHLYYARMMFLQQQQLQQQQQQQQQRLQHYLHRYRQGMTIHQSHQIAPTTSLDQAASYPVISPIRTQKYDQQDCSKHPMEPSTAVIGCTETSSAKIASSVRTPRLAEIVREDTQTVPAKLPALGSSTNDITITTTPSTTEHSMTTSLTHPSSAWTDRTPSSLTHHARACSLPSARTQDAANLPNDPTASISSPTSSSSSPSKLSVAIELNNDIRINHRAVPMKDKWMARYEALVEFKKKFGHTKVPHNFEDSPKLAEWQKFQRQQRKLYIQGKHSQLTSERVDLLERLGFVWEARLDAWETHYDGLASFKDRHGHVHVPVADVALSQWIKRQRKQFKRYENGQASSLTDDRVARLNRLGFVWDGRHLAGGNAT